MAKVYIYLLVILTHSVHKARKSDSRADLHVAHYLKTADPAEIASRVKDREDLHVKDRHVPKVVQPVLKTPVPTKDMFKHYKSNK